MVAATAGSRSVFGLPVMGREAYGSLLRFVGHMAQAQFLDCHVADKFGSWRPSDTWNPSCFAEGTHELEFQLYRGPSCWRR